MTTHRHPCRMRLAVLAIVLLVGPAMASSETLFGARGPEGWTATSVHLAGRGYHLNSTILLNGPSAGAVVLIDRQLRLLSGGFALQTEGGHVAYVNVRTGVLEGEVFVDPIVPRPFQAYGSSSMDCDLPCVDGGFYLVAYATANASARWTLQADDLSVAASTTGQHLLRMDVRDFQRHATVDGAVAISTLRHATIEPAVALPFHASNSLVGMIDPQDFHVSSTTADGSRTCPCDFAGIRPGSLAGDYTFALNGTGTFVAITGADVAFPP